MKGSNSGVPDLFLTAASLPKVTENINAIGGIMKAQRPNMIFLEVVMNCL